MQFFHKNNWLLKNSFNGHVIYNSSSFITYSPTNLPFRESAVMQKGILFQSAMGHQSHIEEVQHMLYLAKNSPQTSNLISWHQHQPIENPKQ